ncbi:MAG: symporter small accessory protein [Candidatus Marinarcus sp.]|uniref:symporter small accessory protein n=1 Tax=Candidatus Marinarcus sp. TaxID=3100987 RepID=UPI003B000D1B
MEQFDFGINLAFWFSILSTLLCIYYGAVNWNKENEENSLSISTKKWAKTEDQIEKSL